MTFGRNKFGKRVAKNFKTRICFQKMSRDQVDKIIDQLQLSKSIPKFQIHIMQETNNT